MRAILRYCAVAAVCVTATLAQTVDIYTTPSTDGTNMYVTGVMQVSMANSPVCEEPNNHCASATHTYTQTVTITSPSGRVGSCNFKSSYPALTTVDLQCEAALDIDGESGTYTSTDEQQADCTIAGLFLASETTIQNPLIVVSAYYYSANIGGQVLYTRCNPNTVSNVLGLLTGGKPPFILWTGVQIQITTTLVCVPTNWEQENACHAPDPIPGGTPLGGQARVAPPAGCVPAQPDALAPAEDLDGSASTRLAALPLL